VALANWGLMDMILHPTCTCTQRGDVISACGHVHEHVWNGECVRVVVEVGE
jgi:hypothetical protein